MFAPVDQILDTPAVSALVGGSGTDSRIYGSGIAPDGVTTPYITWFTVSDSPFEQVSGAPPADSDAVQIDIYAKDERTVKQLAVAVRNALDDAACSNRLIFDQREVDTKLYRVSLQADVIQNRN